MSDTERPLIEVASERSVVKVCFPGEVVFVGPASHAEYSGQFTHITLPLDAAQLDDAGVEVAAIVIFGKGWKHCSPSGKAAFKQSALAALAAYAAHVAGGARYTRNAPIFPLPPGATYDETTGTVTREVRDGE